MSLKGKRMTTMPVHQLLPRVTAGDSRNTPELNPRMSPIQIERRVNRVGLRTLMLLVVGITVVSFTLAVFLAGWDLALLFTVGTTLFALLFGGPFWIAAYDDIVRAERDRCLGPGSR